MNGTQTAKPTEAAITEAFETRDNKNIQTLKAVKIVSRVFWSPLSDPVVLKYNVHHGSDILLRYILSPLVSSALPLSIIDEFNVVHNHLYVNGVSYNSQDTHF